MDGSFDEKVAVDNGANGQFETAQYMASPHALDRILIRGTDLALAWASLVLLAPLLIVLALAVATETGRWPFRAHRYTVGTVTFKVWSLGSGGSAATGLSRWIRDARLEGLPQLWSVATGHLSLVGPPILAGRREGGGSSAMPGLVGYRQLSRFLNITAAEAAAKEGAYIRCPSFVTYASILWLGLQVLSLDR